MKRKILFVLLCFFGLGVSAEQMLEMVKLSQAEQIEYVSSFAKLKFRNDSIFIYDHSGQLVSSNALTNVQVILFSESEDIETGIDDVSQEEGALLKVYPNPATYQIRVENYEPVQSIRIYSVQGQDMPIQSIVSGNEATVNVSSLAEGAYVIFVNQTAFKFIKK